MPKKDHKGFRVGTGDRRKKLELIILKITGQPIIDWVPIFLEPILGGQ